MAYSYFIIQSSVKGERNWSGKEFSNAPAKIYACYNEVHDALSAYWFSDYATMTDARRVTIVPISEQKKNKMLAEGKIRF